MILYGFVVCKILIASILVLLINFADISYMCLLPRILVNIICITVSSIQQNILLQWDDDELKISFDI